MNGFTDIHSHFIYGIDDGAKNRETMERMLDAAFADGIRRLIATPHVSPGVRPVDIETYKKHFFEAQQYLDKMGYDIRLMVGAENLYTPALPGYAQGHRLITLAGSEYLLMEFVPDEELEEICYAVDFVSSLGYVPVIAHVERYANLPYKEAEKLKAEYRIEFQINCGTLLRDKGYALRRNTRRFIKSGLVSCLACDAHDLHRRPFNMSKGYGALASQYGCEQADRLCKA